MEREGGGGSLEGLRALVAHLQQPVKPFDLLSSKYIGLPPPVPARGHVLVEICERKQRPLSFTAAAARGVCTWALRTACHLRAQGPQLGQGANARAYAMIEAVADGGGPAFPMPAAQRRVPAAQTQSVAYSVWRNLV